MKRMLIDRKLWRYPSLSLDPGGMPSWFGGWQRWVAVTTPSPLTSLCKPNAVTHAGELRMTGVAVGTSHEVW